MNSLMERQPTAIARQKNKRRKYNASTPCPVIILNSRRRRRTLEMIPLARERVPGYDL